MLASPLTPSVHQIMIAEVERRMGVPAGSIRAPGRRVEVSAARHAVVLVLSLSGLTPAQIGRVLGRDHSTIINSLMRAGQHPEWRELLAPVLDMTGCGGQRPALLSWIDRELQHVTSQERNAVHAYITCTLLAWERHTGSLCVCGLLLVLTKPRIRAAVEEALRRCELASETYRIDLHATQLSGRR